MNNSTGKYNFVTVTNKLYEIFIRVKFKPPVATGCFTYAPLNYITDQIIVQGVLRSSRKLFMASNTLEVVSNFMQEF